tara:strand:+ start:74133 stop:74495 length:363 start_codon:yes stop_codon:yes gene_type:complete
MNFLSGQEMHNLAMKIVGDQLKNSGYEFLSVNSELKKDPQFVCLKDKKVFFVIIRAIRFPNNPDYFDLNNFKKIIEHAKSFKAQVFYAGVGLGNPKNLKLKLEKNQSYTINYNGLKKIKL